MSRQEGKVHQGQDVKCNTNRSPVCCYFVLSVTIVKELPVYRVIPLVPHEERPKNYDLTGSVIQQQQLLLCITVINYIYIYITNFIKLNRLYTTYK